MGPEQSGDGSPSNDTKRGTDVYRDQQSIFPGSRGNVNGPGNAYMTSGDPSMRSNNGPNQTVLPPMNLSNVNYAGGPTYGANRDNISGTSNSNSNGAGSSYLGRQYGLGSDSSLGANSQHKAAIGTVSHQQQPQQYSQYQLAPPVMASGSKVESEQPPNTGRTRMRVSKACDRCRTQKIKCSGTHPCLTCTKQKRECNYSSNYATHEKSPEGGESYPGAAPYSVYGKRRNVREEPILGFPIMQNPNDKQYIEHLKNRVHYLESLLADNSAQVFNRRPFQDDLERLVLVSPSSKWRFSRRHQNLLTSDLCNHMYHNLSEESRKLVTLPRRQYFGWNMSGCNYLSPDELPEMPDIPSHVNTIDLISYFLEHINPLYSILHENVFLEQVEVYRKIVKEESDIRADSTSRESKTYQTRLFSAILYLVYALSIRFIEMAKPRGPALPMLELEEKCFKYGHKVVSILSFEWESFELIQSWLLITLYLRVSHRQTSSNHALGQAIIMTNSMGIGQDNFKIEAATSYERMKCERIFWSVYTFDRMFGIQTGRYCGIRDEDHVRALPSMDALKETVYDEWMTSTSFAMLHLARIANYIHTSRTDEPGAIKYQQLNKELALMEEWFEANGYNIQDLFNDGPEIPKAPDQDNTPEEGNKKNAHKKVDPLLKAQVKLHFYDLILSIHGKIVFRYFGHKIDTTGLELQMVLDACAGVVSLLERCHKAGLLYVPWYQTLLLLFNVGIFALTFINAGTNVIQARDILKGCISLVSIIKRASVRDEGSRKVLIKERFKMAKECLWALKMANRMLSLRFQEDIKSLDNIGVDHGPSDVNIQMFSQIGLNQDSLIKRKLNRTEDEFSALLKKQLHRSDGIPANDNDSDYESAEESMGGDNKRHKPPLHTGSNSSPNLHQRASIGTPSSSSSLDQRFGLQPDDLDNNATNLGEPLTGVDYMLGNLQWFDQWMDFNMS